MMSVFCGLLGDAKPIRKWDKEGAFASRDSGCGARSFGKGKEKPKNVFVYVVGDKKPLSGALWMGFETGESD
jgi:hypothetical protein